MKSLLKKIALCLLIISTVNVQYTSASWYNPIEFISKTITRIRSLFIASASCTTQEQKEARPSSTGFIAHILAFFGLSQTASAPAINNRKTINNNLQMMVESGLMQPYPATAVIASSGKEAISHVESAEQFKDIINEYVAAVRPIFTNKSNWFASAALNQQLPEKFVPFVQKADIPADSIVAFHGDLHGDYLTLQQYLKSLAEQHYINADTLKIINKQFYMVFLGDYADRGPNGVDVYSTLMQLKMKNQDNVFVLRGNHEDLNIQAMYGFIQELNNKFGKVEAELLEDSLDSVYNILPIALYLRIGNPQNNEYIMCCHGLWEFGYDPAPFLKDTSSHYQAFNVLERKTVFERIKKDPDAQALAISLEKSGLKVDEDISNIEIHGGSYAIGFLWDDIKADKNSSSYFNRQRGMEWSQQDIESLCNLLLKKHIAIKAIYRAHQHGDKMLWQQFNAKGWAKNGNVYTFLVAPNAGYGNSFDAWGQLQVGNSYEKSVLKIKTNNSGAGK